MSASEFKEQIAADNAAIFLNDEEFAEMHDLNGTECLAIVQDISLSDNLSIGRTENYPWLYGAGVQISCKADDLEEIPVVGMSFTLDEELYMVAKCDNDMGLLSIFLVGNER